MSRRRAWGEDSTSRIELAGGASVSLSFKGNLFDLPPKELELIANLSDVIQRFKDVVANGQPCVELQKT